MFGLNGGVRTPPASDSPTVASTRSGWRGLLPLLLVALLAQLSQAHDYFGNLTRPVVLWILQVAGIAASDRGDVLSVGSLEVPWSRDCAGLNLLIILLAVAIWMNRHERPGLAYWLRIAAMLPAAVLANVARVFTIIAYRKIFFPAIESPQLHYFFGLLWLVPFAILAIPRDSRPRSTVFFELLHTASVVALLSPLVDGPGGAGLSIAVVLGLAHCRVPDVISPRRVLLLAIWLAAAAGIIWFGVESFWMPWLLVCPLVAQASWLKRPEGLVLLLASHPMFGLLPGAEIVTWLTIAYAVWRQFSHEAAAATAGPSARDPWAGAAMVTGALAFVLPFLSSGFFGMGETASLRPPEGLLQKEIPGSGYQVQLPGQGEDIGLLWYLPSGSQRHHTLKICMKYRGIDLEPSKEDPAVMTDGKLWMREFFLKDGRLIDSHLDYVKSTVGPRESPGVHLIFVSESDTFPAAEFNRRTQALAAGLAEKPAGAQETVEKK